MVNDDYDEVIGLALSGGGFRAALFHLGVVRYLRDEGLLSRVSHITSVSGGSILAAHLLLNWKLYNGEAIEFEECAAELIEFIQSDVRGRILRRSIYRPTITLLTEMYDKLYKGKPLSMFDTTSTPELHILATNVTKGCQTSFTVEGVFNYLSDRAINKIAHPSIPIAKAVAASSAFPGFFAPVLFTHNDSGDLQNNFIPQNQLLADGGLFDNLGTRHLLKINRDYKQIIVSNGSAPFDWDLRDSTRKTLYSALRGVDILAERVRDLEEDFTSRSIGTKAISHLDIQSSCDYDPVLGVPPQAIQSQLKSLRTDLDTFSDDEVGYLVRHGYSVAMNSFQSARNVWSPFPKDSRSEQLNADSIAHKIREGQKRRVKIFSFRDWISYAYVVAISALLWAGVSVFTWWHGNNYTNRDLPRDVITDHDTQLAEVKTFINSAQSELWMSGTHFQITLYNQVDNIVKAVLTGVDVNILMFDPNSHSLSNLSRTLRHSPEGLSNEICGAIENIDVLNDRISSRRSEPEYAGVTGVGKVSLKIYSEIPQGRMYLVDPGSINGKVLYIPYLNLQKDTNAPAYLFSSKSNIGKTYHSATVNHWNNAVDLAELGSNNSCSGFKK